MGHLLVFLMHAQHPPHRQYFALVIIIVSELKEAAMKKVSKVQGSLFLSICTFICQDQLLVLAVFLSCPLERGGSQLERGARGYALSPLCGDTWRTWETQCRCREEEWEGTHLKGMIFVFSQKSVFCFFFERPFRCRYICCQENRFTGGTRYWREGKGSQLKCFLSNCQRHLVTDPSCRALRTKHRAVLSQLPKTITWSQWFKTSLNLNVYYDVKAMRCDTSTCSRSGSLLPSQGESCWVGHSKLMPIPSPQTV